MKKEQSIKNIQENVRQKSLPYQKLSLIYDKMMQHVEYGRWAKYIKKIIEQFSPISPYLLDVGCGTGQFIKKIRQLGIPADGCDISPTMIALARKKNPDANFWVDQMPQLAYVPNGKYSIITCLYDTINYLPNIQSLTQTITRVYDLLPKQGLFIFDVVSESFCLHYFHDIEENEIIDECFAYSRYSHYHLGTKQQVNEIQIYTPEGIFEERHVQKIFTFRKIKSVIHRKTDFRLLAVYENFSFFEAEEDSNRAHFILQKSG